MRLGEELEGLNNLIKNLVSDPFAGDIEQNKAAIAQAVAENEIFAWDHRRKTK
jgi:hypothetical protein